MRERKSGFALVEIMLVVATTALLAVFSIPRFMRNRIAENVSSLQVILKTISTAAENYALANSGKYPASANDLTQASEASPAYLKENYCDGKIRNGYRLSCDFNAYHKGYTIIARPKKCGVTGDRSFVLTTGGVISTDATCVAASRQEKGLTRQ